MLIAGLCLLAIGFAAYFGFLVSTNLGTRIFASVAVILLTVVCLTVLAAPHATLNGSYASALLAVAGLLMAPTLIGWIIGGSIGLVGRPRAQR